MDQHEISSGLLGAFPVIVLIVVLLIVTVAFFWEKIGGTPRNDRHDFDDWHTDDRA